jgi:hypothetical protein
LRCWPAEMRCNSLCYSSRQAARSATEAFERSANVMTDSCTTHRFAYLEPKARVRKNTGLPRTRVFDRQSRAAFRFVTVQNDCVCRCTEALSDAWMWTASPPFTRISGEIVVRSCMCGLLPADSCCVLLRAIPVHITHRPCRLCYRSLPYRDQRARSWLKSPCTHNHSVLIKVLGSSGAVRPASAVFSSASLIQSAGSPSEACTLPTTRSVCCSKLSHRHEMEANITPAARTVRAVHNLRQLRPLLAPQMQFASPAGAEAPAKLRQALSQIAAIRIEQADARCLLTKQHFAGQCRNACSGALRAKAEPLCAAPGTGRFAAAELLSRVRTQLALRCVLLAGGRNGMLCCGRGQTGNAMFVFVLLRS